MLKFLIINFVVCSSVFAKSINFVELESGINRYASLLGFKSSFNIYHIDFSPRIGIYNHNCFYDNDELGGITIKKRLYEYELNLMKNMYTLNYFKINILIGVKKIFSNDYEYKWKTKDKNKPSFFYNKKHEIQIKYFGTEFQLYERIGIKFQLNDRSKIEYVLFYETNSSPFLFQIKIFNTYWGLERQKEINGINSSLIYKFNTINKKPLFPKRKGKTFLKKYINSFKDYDRYLGLVIFGGGLFSILLSM